MSTPIQPMRYRPTAEGLERWFGPLEAAVMAEAWAGRGPRTVKQIWRALAGRELSYTTVMTTMFRLVDKGLLSRARPLGGVAHLYAPTCSKAEFVELQTRAIVASLESERGA